jgi:WD40 repeat protein
MICGGSGVKIWKVVEAGFGSDGRPRQSFKEMPSPGRTVTNSACFSPDSKLLAWYDPSPRVIWVRDLETGQERSWKAQIYLFLALSWLPDSKHLVMVNWPKGQIEVQDAETGKVETAFGSKDLLAGDTIHTALSRDGAWLAVGGSKAVTVWNMNNQELVVALPEERGTVWSLAWSPDREHLAVGSSDGGLVIWNLPKINTELTRIGLGW